MQRFDLLLAIVLVVAAAGSAIGVVTYEDDRIASFRVDWVTRSSEVEVPPFDHAGGGEAESTFEVSVRNLTRIEVEVTIAGAAARVQPTQVRVELVGPNNVSVAEEGELPLGPTATATFPLALDLAPVPEGASVQAPDLEGARRTLDAALASTQGVGNWTLRVSFAPGVPGPLGEEAHAVSAVATLTSYEAEVAPSAPEVGPR